jgi:hypothetical protein
MTRCQADTYNTAPVLPDIVNSMWFKDREDDGVTFSNYFGSEGEAIPLQTVALVCTAVSKLSSSCALFSPLLNRLRTVSTNIMGAPSRTSHLLPVRIGQGMLRASDILKTLQQKPRKLPSYPVFADDSSSLAGM